MEDFVFSNESVARIIIIKEEASKDTRHLAQIYSTAWASVSVHRGEKRPGNYANTDTH